MHRRRLRDLTFQLKPTYSDNALARLLTVDGHLATGNSASPILSYFAYEDMFGEIEALAAQHECEMTCYVDDMVFTGQSATRRLLRELIKVVRRYRLWGHKTKVFKAGQPKVITGVAVTRVGMKLPNRRQRSILDETAASGAARTDEERLLIMRSLVGRLFEAAQIDRAWHPEPDWPNSVILAKNAIDALSVLSLHLVPAGRKGCAVVSTGGATASLPEWIEAWNPGRIFCAYDATRQGDDAAARLIRNDSRVVRLRPALDGLDWNDMLMRDRAGEPLQIDDRPLD